MAFERKLILDSLKPHVERLKSIHMREMFKENPSRFDEFSISFGDLLLDYSKNKIDARAMNALFEIAKKCEIEKNRDDMWAGEKINNTEDRAVMHMALRYFGKEVTKVDGKEIMPKIRQELSRIKDFSDKIHNAQIVSSAGEKFTDIVNIGIGGSDLGSKMVVNALSSYTSKKLKIHFVSNVDGAHIADTLKNLNPKTTLFLIASKTFTTDETMTNANTARNWLKTALGEGAIKSNFIAISTNLKACNDFGITNENIFIFWDWVGGRFSLFSAIGLSIALSIGYENFEQFLKGAAKMDEHFLTAPIKQNLPIILALVGIWNRNGINHQSQAILPYDQRLSRFPAYLQQLDMESNGKSIDKSGYRVEYETGAVVFGEAGTNGQHAFYQLLHQGSDIIPSDFLVAANAHENLGDHHEKLLANCFAQSEALMNGKSLNEVIAELAQMGLNQEEIKKLAPHKVFEGNRPSNTLIYNKLDPKTLGMLIALYEHKIFVQGIIWDINSFDQFGVELGKQLARGLLPKIRGDESYSEENPSTTGLIKHFHSLKD